MKYLGFALLAVLAILILLIVVAALKAVKIKAKAGQGGRLFGSVTSKEIAEHLKKQYAIDIDKRKITAPDIKAFGSYAVTVKLYQGVSADFTVMVTEG